MNFRDYLKTTKIVGLSPMDGVTDEAMRLTQAQISKPDVTFTEFVSAEGIAHGAVKLFDQLLYSEIERPIVGQLFGKDPGSFYLAAIILSALGFDGIDINMGCPAKTVTQHGSGAALIDKPELASQIINSVRQGIDDFASGKTRLSDLKLKQKTLSALTRNQKYSNLDSSFTKPTLSVKTRLGVDSPIVEIWIPHLLAHHLDFLTIHGRTLKQAYTGRADWSEIAKVVKLAQGTNTLIWGNGDIQSRAEGEQKILKVGVDGVLIGRATLGNPWVFANRIPDFNSRFQAMISHAQTFASVFPNRRFDPLRRYFLAYTHSHPRAKELRQKIVALTSIDQLLALEAEFCDC